MPRVKAKSGAGGRALRKGAARRAKAAASGAFVLAADAAPYAKTSIPIASEAIGTLSRNGRRVGQLMESFGEALKRMQKTKRAFRLMVEVEPKGLLKIREIKSAGEESHVVREPASHSSELDRALAAARERGRSRVAEILSRPEMLSADSFAQLLGTTRATINSKRQNRQLLALEGATRGFRFPSWQIGEDGKPYAALPQLFARLGDSPWAVYRFLVQSHPELDGETAREALRHGRSVEVMEAAASVADTFA